jgi:hypothetical protein
MEDGTAIGVLISSQINYRMRVTLNDGRQMTGQVCTQPRLSVVEKVANHSV